MKSKQYLKRVLSAWKYLNDIALNDPETPVEMKGEIRKYLFERKQEWIRETEQGLPRYLPVWKPKKYQYLSLDSEKIIELEKDLKDHEFWLSQRLRSSNERTHARNHDAMR